MPGKELQDILTQIEHLHELGRRLKGSLGAEKPVQLHGVDSPGGRPPEEIDHLINTIINGLADEDAKQDGTTIVFALMESKEGRVANSLVSTSYEADVNRTLANEDDLVRFCNAFANPARLRLMHRLLSSQATSAELSEATGLVGGQLYHHLKELMLAGLVTQVSRNLYALSTQAGKPAFLGIHLLAKTLAHLPAKLTGADLELGNTDEGTDI